MSDYFAVLGLPRHLGLDLAALSQRYRERSWATHPDRRTRAEQGEAMAESALLNEAYRTLRDPYRRAQHLLGLEGIALTTSPPQDLLMEVFEVQELLEDPNTSAQVLEEQRQHWQGRVTALDETLSKAGSDWDQGAQEALPQIQKILLQRQYFLQILEKLMAIGLTRDAGPVPTYSNFYTNPAASSNNLTFTGREDDGTGLLYYHGIALPDYDDFKFKL